MSSSPEIKVCPTPPTSRTRPRSALELSEAAIELTGRFSIALSGGSRRKACTNCSPRRITAPQVDWPSVDVFFGDERVRAAGSRARATTAWPARRCSARCRSPATTSTACAAKLRPNEAAKEYGQMLKEKFGDAGTGPRAARHGRRRPHRVAVPGTAGAERDEAPLRGQLRAELNTWRLTLTAPFINRAQT